MSLITTEERTRLQQTVGTRQTIIASAIARLHLASPDPKALRKNDPNSILRTFRNLNSEEWTFTNVVGALVFIIDRSMDAFIFQIYDLQSFQLRFEYELYEDITYDILSPQFHSFEMEDCCAGFCFADPGEAKSFLSKVMALKPTTKKAGANLLKKEKKAGFFKGFFGGSKKTLNDDDIVIGGGDLKIGEVRMIKHEQHVGLNADGTFDTKNLPSHWKQMFKEAGIRKKDLQNPETAGAIMAAIQQTEMQQEIAEMYQQDPEYQDLSEDQIEEYVGDLMTQEQLDAYEKYQEELRQYYEDLAAYEAEQEALAAWEKDNAQYVSRRISIPGEKSPKAAAGDKAAPPLPPRKVKDLQKEAKEIDRTAKTAEKQYQQADKQYRMSVRRAEKNPQFEDEAAAALRAAEEARRLADEAQKERDRIMAEIEELKKGAAAAAPSSKGGAASRLSRAMRRASSKRLSGPPPVPPPPPPMDSDDEDDAAPPPPPPPPPPPAAPMPPQLPKLPALPKVKKPDGAPSNKTLLRGINNVKLAKAQQVNDRSKPQTTRPKPGGIMGAIEGGVQLKKTPAKKDPSALPDLKDMKPKAQNLLMAKLIETMNERRKQLGEEDDSEDEWSD